LDEKDQGEIGPSLEEVALRLSEAGLRQRIVDPRKINPDTIMPPYFSLDGLFEVGADFQDNTIYSAQEVEDVVSYLLTLTGGFQK
jgi:sulfur-oxidizing protein SoxX